MNPESYQQNPTPPPPFNPRQKVGGELTVTQPGEETVLVMKRHPIGIIMVYVGIAIVLSILAVLIFGLLPNIEADSGSNQLTQIGSIIFLILTTFSLIYALIATVVYWGNRWVVTTDSLTQIAQVSLFGKQSSQLALDDVEDVTAEKNGILAHIFNYGMIRVETAGHHGKFIFNYAPNPNFYAQRILAVREAVERAEKGHHSQVVDSHQTISHNPAPYQAQNPQGQPPSSDQPGFNTNWPQQPPQ